MSTTLDSPADHDGTTLRREVRIPIYWLVVGLMMMVASPLLSLYTSVKINENTIRKDEAARAAAQVEGLRVYCRLIGTQVDVYSESTTDNGKRAYDTWLTEYRRQGCTPGK